MSSPKELEPKPQNPEEVESPERIPGNIPKNLKDLYESWDVANFLEYTLGKLPPDWLVILNISRKLLAGKAIKGIQIPDSLIALTQRDMELIYEKRLVTKKGYRKSESPSTDKEVRQIENPSEIAKTLPPYLLLEDLDPDLFDYKALTRSLPVLDYAKPQITIEETSKDVEELTPKAEKGTNSRQKAYVLLDISPSMSDNYKMIFAKAVVLSYLAKAQEEGSTVYLRSFYNSPGPLSVADNRQMMHPLAERVLRIAEHGGTDINSALKQAIRDVSELDQITKTKQFAETEILIITDAESYTGIPKVANNIKLHTLHLRGGKEGTGADHLDYPIKLAALKKESATFTQIYTGKLFLDDSVEEKWELLKEVESLENELQGDHPSGSSDTKENLKKRLDAAKNMTEVYEKISRDKDLKSANKRLQKLKKSLEKLFEKREKKKDQNLSTTMKSLTGEFQRDDRVPFGTTVSGYEFRIKDE